MKMRILGHVIFSDFHTPKDLEDTDKNRIESNLVDLSLCFKTISIHAHEGRNSQFKNIDNKFLRIGDQS